MTTTLVFRLGSTALQHSLLQNIRWEQSDVLFLSPKDEGKIVHIHDVKVCRGNRGIAPLSLNFGSMEVSG